MPIANKKPQAKWPPAAIREGETDVEKKARLQQEAEAKQVSDQIDQQIEQDRQRRNRSMGAKVLLLGQAESGKSTVLKNLQLHLAPKAFEREVEAWRPVIHLNLVRSVNFIVNLILSQNQGRRDSLSDGQRKSSNSANISPELRKLCIRLAPLRQVEDSLIKSLWGDAPPKPNSESMTQAFGPRSITLPTGYSWKRALGLHKASFESISSSSTRSTRPVDGQNHWILAALGDDIVALWDDSGVQDILQTAEINLREHPGFFLDQVRRITQGDYSPIHDDVFRARVTTEGPEEHTIIPEAGTDRSKNWTIYEVRGSQWQRAAWVQYIDDINMVVFMAPISAFNQVLAEDESVNRLTDSLQLWRMICNINILAGVDFILFLNKLDILDAKLKSGIQFSSFVTSYTNKPNETKPVSRHLLDVFISIHQQLATPRRSKLHPHLTCAVDTTATLLIIDRIHDVIFKKMLEEKNLI